ncbi:hypothetical protein LVB87_03360 [Lysobacter sp. KIS68-7]|uniref:hypothetical protein n=1 Tax=Lysobacter sp. KIS68-7 TaxID=2904252 RepID=UPI001E363333|nr:hypothetical protein [Lysobacter sp. KIS68-7]UHQ20214.1 hypothetical protein LVB87_03360 [Lysobacter sp. KIS68-7]
MTPQSWPAIDWDKVIAIVAGVTDFLGDLATVVLGVITIYGLIKYRKKLSATFRLLRIEHLTERRKEIAKTLELLDQSIVKGKSPDARALFGRLDGQLSALCDVFPEFSELQKQVSSIAHNNAPLTEATKQKLIYQVSAKFETFKLTNMNDIAGEQR